MRRVDQFVKYMYVLSSNGELLFLLTCSNVFYPFFARTCAKSSDFLNVQIRAREQERTLEPYDVIDSTETLYQTRTVLC